MAENLMNGVGTCMLQCAGEGEPLVHQFSIGGPPGQSAYFEDSEVPIEAKAALTTYFELMTPLIEAKINP